MIFNSVIKKDAFIDILMRDIYYSQITSQRLRDLCLEEVLGTVLSRAPV